MSGDQLLSRFWGCSTKGRLQTLLPIQLRLSTTGLDASAALELMHLLKAVAARGRAVVLSIHQPRDEIFSAMDNIIVMSQGEVLSVCPPQEIVETFQVRLEGAVQQSKDNTHAQWLTSKSTMKIPKTIRLKRCEHKKKGRKTLATDEAGSNSWSEPKNDGMHGCIYLLVYNLSD